MNAITILETTGVIAYILAATRLLEIKLEYMNHNVHEC